MLFRSICSGAWLLALIHKQLVGYQPDEVYIGTAEERAAAEVGDIEQVDEAVPVK